MKIRDNIARHNLSLKESCSLGPSTGPSVGAQKVKCFGWHAFNTEIQVANELLALFRKPLDHRHFSPLLAHSIRCMALVYLDACIFQGFDMPVYREKISMLMRILGVHGKIWEASRSLAEELRDVVAEYLLTSRDSPAPSHGVIWPPAAAVAASELTGDNDVLNFSSFNALGSMDVWVPPTTDQPIDV